MAPAVFATATATAPALSATPAWIAGIGDAVVKSDLKSLAATKTASQTQVGKIFTDLAAELKAGKATLSASQFADLKLVVANLASLGASDYVRYVANALVNGNAANAFWTGGGAPVALGNLAVGESVTGLTELTAKWFLGQDNPASTVTMLGNKFSISHSASTLPLFGAKGPTAADINQGYLGDCWLESSLAEVASQNPDAIRSMITDNHNGTYGVRFFANGQAQYVTVDNELANGGAIFNKSGSLWASLVEKAYAEWSVATQQRYGGAYQDSYSVIGNGSWPGYALGAITGASTYDLFAANGMWWSGATGAQITNAAALSVIAANLAVGGDVELCSESSAKDSAGKTTLVANHAMSIYGYDSATGMLEIRNPWGAESWQSWDTNFEVGIATLLAGHDYITLDNAGTATSVSNTSVVAAAGLQGMAQVKSFSVSDSIANVAVSLKALAGESKLSALTVNDTAGADTLDLTGLKVATTVNIGANAGKASLSGAKAVSGGQTASALGLGAASSYDLLTLGSGDVGINYTAKSGVLDVVNFNAAHDVLSVKLNGGALLQTIVGGGDWISTTADASHGVYLAGVLTIQKVTVSAGLAMVA